MEGPACNICEDSGIIAFSDGSEQICACAAGDRALADMVAPRHPHFAPWSPEAVRQYTEGRLVCSPDRFENGIDPGNAESFVLCHGGSVAVAEKFGEFVRSMDGCGPELWPQHIRAQLQNVLDNPQLTNAEIAAKISETFA